MNYGMDYQGGGGGGGFGGGGGGSQSQGTGGRTRRSYDEQTLIPVTVSMALGAKMADDDTGHLQLGDGRSIHHVKIVGAVRSVEDYSTNVMYEIEDGTGLVDVKQWIDDNACSAAAEMRQQTVKENIYVRLIGEMKNFDGKKTIVASSIRPLTTGNELTHHMLEVIYSAEHHKRADTYVAAQPMVMSNVGGVGFGGGMSSVGAPLSSAAGVGDNLRESVLNFIREQGDQSDTGANVQQCIQMLSGTHSEGNIRKTIEDLAAEGIIYSTIDEHSYKYAM